MPCVITLNVIAPASTIQSVRRDIVLQIGLALWQSFRLKVIE
jgi:hypothetical protein